MEFIVNSYFYYLIIMLDFFMTSVHYVNDSKLRFSRAYNIHIFWKYFTKEETIVNCHRAVLNEIWILFQLLARMSNYLFRFSELTNFSSSMMIDFWQFRCISRSNYTIERRNRFVVQLFCARLKLDRTRGTRVLRKKLAQDRQPGQCLYYSLLSGASSLLFPYPPPPSR